MMVHTQRVENMGAKIPCIAIRYGLPVAKFVLAAAVFLENHGHSLSILHAQAYDPLEGEAHPAFVLPAIDDGRPVSLEQFRGRKVLLIQFASW